jgi:hypothetical protein
VRTKLVLRHPWKQPPETWWTFSGAEDRIIRGAIEALDDFQAYPGSAALVLFEEEGGSPTRPTWPIGAWTRAGALRLAELLPDELADVRADLSHHYADPP